MAISKVYLKVELSVAAMDAMWDLFLAEWMVGTKGDLQVFPMVTIKAEVMADEKVLRRAFSTAMNWAPKSDDPLADC